MILQMILCIIIVKQGFTCFNRFEIKSDPGYLR